MRQLFDEMPRIEGEGILLREMVDGDAAALGELAGSDVVYRHEPTFLYERRYDDKHEVIARMREECFDTHESVLLAICLSDAPDEMLGIAEIYAFEEQKPKASIGYRLMERAWGRGIATRVAGLLKRYLLDEVGMRTITAHVLPENAASARVLEKNGFRRLFADIPEDWGFGELVPVDKWIYKRRWEHGFLDD